jgi:hypothetical protein
MTREQARLGVLREWRGWRDANGVTTEATGNDGLRFYGHRQSRRAELLKFKGAGDKWQIVHGWLLNSGCVRD